MPNNSSLITSERICLTTDQILIYDRSTVFAAGLPADLAQDSADRGCLQDQDPRPTLLRSVLNSWVETREALFTPVVISVSRGLAILAGFSPFVVSHLALSTIKVTVIHPSAGQNHYFRSVYLFVYYINSSAAGCYHFATSRSAYRLDCLSKSPLHPGLYYVLLTSNMDFSGAKYSVAGDNSSAADDRNLPKGSRLLVIISCTIGTFSRRI
jgi:hypothetical protein